MSREYKYKAYINNPIHGTGIFKVKSINFNPLVVTVIIPNGKYIDGIELTDEVQFFEGEVELLEYTGLDDKNEQEVYEGYILEFNLNIGNGKVEAIKVPVIYYTCEFAIFIDDYENSFYLSLSDLVGELGQDFKVLGNIYQNPELLQN